jgi:hypothetical protein
VVDSAKYVAFAGVLQSLLAYVTLSVRDNLSRLAEHVLAAGLNPKP